MTAVWAWLPAIVSWLAAGVSVRCAFIARRHRREVEALLRRHDRPPTQFVVRDHSNTAAAIDALQQQQRRLRLIGKVGPQ